MPIQSILVAVDFGDAAARAVAVGGAMAARCQGASLRLLHAESIDAPAYFTSAFEAGGLNTSERACAVSRKWRRVHDDPIAVTDERYGPVEPALERNYATLLAASVPEPRTAAWTSNYGEPLVRYCTVPILFVPELKEGASL